jgi:hypothetical protein
VPLDSWHCNANITEHSNSKNKDQEMMEMNTKGKRKKESKSRTLLRQLWTHGLKLQSRLGLTKYPTVPIDTIVGVYA